VKAQVTSLSNENEGLRGSLQAMGTQIKVLTEALQLQFEPKVVKIERISPHPGFRGPRSFGGVASARMMGLRVDAAPPVVSEPALAEVVPSDAIESPTGARSAGLQIDSDSGIVS
jgi:hypothetical protein